ncbi:transposase family protein [Streptomyces sp. MUM 2J]|uniref:transposase family protein n=1 Tax=Streptomyces sp. MUM 2J TaxID=2791987 RepID=UPI0035ABDF34|nr:transposase family protein [Streptomyces sp. MUM 2J]
MVHLRTGLPHAALAELYGIACSTISRAIGEIRPLPAVRGFAVPDHSGVRLRTLADVLPTRRPRGSGCGRMAPRPRFADRRQAGPDGGAPSPARRGGTPSRPPPSARARAVCCARGRAARAACTTTAMRTERIAEQFRLHQAIASLVRTVRLAGRPAASRVPSSCSLGRPPADPAPADPTGCQHAQTSMADHVFSASTAICPLGMPS